MEEKENVASNDDLLDMPAALTTSQRLIITPILEMLRKTNGELQDVSKDVRRIREMEEERKRESHSLLRVVLDGLKYFISQAEKRLLGK